MTSLRRLTTSRQHRAVSAARGARAALKMAARPRSRWPPRHAQDGARRDTHHHPTHPLPRLRFRRARGALPAAAMSPSVAELLLQRLEREAAGPGGGLCSLEAAAALGLDHQTLVGAVKSLQALGEVGAAGSGGVPGPALAPVLMPVPVPAGDRGGGAGGHAVGAEPGGRRGAAGRQPRGAALSQPPGRGAAPERCYGEHRGGGHRRRAPAAGSGSLTAAASPRRSCPAAPWASARPWPTSGCAWRRAQAAPASSAP